MNETLIRSVVQQVLAELKVSPLASSAYVGGGQKYAGRYGIFTCVDEAVAAATEAFELLSERTIEDRKRIIDHIRRISIRDCVELGTMEMNETKIGRLQHKIEKLKTLGERTPGVEFLRSEVFSGDHGLAVIEHAPFGVIGCITPVTHSLPTITGNAVSMIAGGNTLAVNPHPSGKKVAAEGVRRFNKAIYEDLGIDNLISLIAEPTLDTANNLFKHRGVKMICVTGGLQLPAQPCNRASGLSSLDLATHRSWWTKQPTWIAPHAASSKVPRMTTTCSALPRKKSSS